MRKLLLGSLLAGATLVGMNAPAQEVLVNADIATSTVWGPPNTYNLQKQIYVLPGASLTIKAGTVIASTTNLGGSLAVSQGGQIFVQGTAANPVIWTSKADVATWVGGDPKTGMWRESANEHGNLTIMGKGYISEDATPGNVATPNANNVAVMEGLLGGAPNDPKTIYGGGDDNDNSGSIAYLSLRYGGRVIGLGNELNGLSLGGIGRATDIHHVEIMNNVDDGVEIWGGCVNLKYFSIWNIGDDSLDVDQGWRGKAQFGLIVQGHSLDASQGSGVGDNCCETDGAENSDWQPVTSTTLYNMTIIGQPDDGDGATAWRDGARVQYRNCVIMDCGERVVRFDNLDGDGALGYGHNGTLSWANCWTSAYNTYSTVNAPAMPTNFYKTQVDGNLCEIKDTVFYNNVDYTEANNRNVFATTNNNVLITTTGASVIPIQSITRGALVVKGGKDMLPVTGLNPLPNNSAMTSVAWAPNDGFFDSERFRGAFRPEVSWLTGWTASDAFGFTPGGAWTDVGESLTGTNGAPQFSITGPFTGGSTVTMRLRNGAPNTFAFIAVGSSRLNAPLLGGTLVPNFQTVGILPIPVGAGGGFTFGFPWPNNIPAGQTYYVQVAVPDAGAPQGVALSNAVCGITK